MPKPGDPVTGNYKLMDLSDDFIKGVELGDEVFTVTIKSFIYQLCWDHNLRKEVTKPVIYFTKGKKGLVMGNQVNKRRIAKYAGSEKVEDWIGVEIKIHNDKTVRNPKTGEYGAIRVVEKK